MYKLQLSINAHCRKKKNNYKEQFFHPSLLYTAGYLDLPEVFRHSQGV